MGSELWGSGDVACLLAPASFYWSGTVQAQDLPLKVSLRYFWKLDKQGRASGFGGAPREWLSYAMSCAGVFNGLTQCLYIDCKPLRFVLFVQAVVKV